MLTGFAEAQTAAEIDWVPREELPENEQEKLLWFKEGKYVAPYSGERDASGPMEAVADNTEQVLDEYIDLSGNVVIERGTNTIRAPRIRVDEQSRVAEIDGPLTVRETGLLITGERALINLFRETGSIDQSSLLVHDVPLRGTASRIERSENRVLMLKDASLTSCEPDGDGWLMSAPELRLDQDAGRGAAKHVVIRVANVPLLYAPRISFPLDQRRKSGFLSPSFGYDSDSGTEAGIPYYFNIAPQVDATYEVQNHSRRGLLHDGQVRFLLGETRNEINGGVLKDDKLYNPSGIVDETGATEFEKQDRWYLNVRHESDFEGPWSTLIDYNTVSDIDYLTDLDGRVGSTSDRYAQLLGSNAGDYRAPQLNRIGRIEWRGRHWQHRVEALAFQILDPNGEPAYKKLPEVATTWRSNLLGAAVRVEGQHTIFDKDVTGALDLDEITGTRSIVDASLSWTRRNTWGYVSPSLGALWRSYDLDEVPEGFDRKPSSTIPRFSVDAGLFFDRFFTLGGDAWQQTLEPRVYLLHVDEEDQDQYPVFDARVSSAGYDSLFRWNRFTGFDRIGDASQLSIGLTSRLIRQDTGNEWLSLSIGQIQYFRDREVNYELQRGDDPTRSRSPVFATARLTPIPGLDLAGTFEYEPDAGRSNRGTFLMSFHSEDYRRLVNLTYVFINPEVQSLNQFSNEEESDLSVIWPLSRRLSAIGRWNFNWDERQTLESFAGIEYNDCCLKARLLVRRFLEYPRDVTVIRNGETGPVTETNEITPADTGIFIEFQFKGLATLSRRLDILLERGIPGYRQRETIIGQ